MLVGLPDDQFQIIGLELTMYTEQFGTQELAMFSPAGLILPRMRSLPGGQGYYRPVVTFHTTMGDYALDGSSSYGGYPYW